MTACEAEPIQSASSFDPALVRRVIAVVRRRRLFQVGNRILVAVSGGPDSVALLYLLHDLRPDWHLDLSVIHVNYGLRGKESDEDAEFVRRLCGRLAVPFIMKRVDLSRRPESRHESMQARARDVRYRIMKAVAAAEGVDRVALGHTADDQAETILMWLLRGAGMTGLAGMPIIREGLFIRPLLATEREELAAGLASRAIAFRMDSTNAKLLYRRNRIRHELLPIITSLSPSFVKLMSRQSEVLGEENRFLEHLVTECLSRTLSQESGHFVLNRSTLVKAPPALQRRLVRRILCRLNPRGAASGLSAVDAVLRQVVNATSGARLILHGIEIVRDGTAIRFMQKEWSASARAGEPIEPLPVGIPGSVIWPATGERIDVERVGAGQARGLMEARLRHVAIFDAATFTSRLIVRTWQHGDRFVPAGMGGKQKKLQDFFTDTKVGRLDRQRIPLLAAPEGILWVARHRADQRFLAGSSTTAFVMARISSDISTEGRD